MLGSLSKLFGAVVARRNKRFDSGRGIVHVDKPVISVGNLSVGGTGKTPVVQLLVRVLQDLGHHPAVILRGYRRSTRGLLVVHDGDSITATTRESGDEAALHAQKLGVPIVVSESKVDAAVHAAGMMPIDVIVVDDGFQHRALHRDLDIVLVDRATLDDPRLLPAGRLREPLSALHRADIVLATGDGVSDVELQPWCKPDVIFGRIQIIAHAPKLSGRSVLALSGIANPQRFHDTLRACGANVAVIKNFRDHHIYTRTDCVNVIALAKQHGVDVATTEKDAVKLTEAMSMFDKAGITVHVVPIEARLTYGNDPIEQRLSSLFTSSFTPL